MCFSLWEILDQSSPTSAGWAAIPLVWPAPVAHTASLLLPVPPGSVWHRWPDTRLQQTVRHARRSARTGNGVRRCGCLLRWPPRSLGLRSNRVQACIDICWNKYICIHTYMPLCVYTCVRIYIYFKKYREKESAMVIPRTVRPVFCLIAASS